MNFKVFLLIFALPIEFLGDEIFMMGWDGEAPQPICLYADSSFRGYTHGQQVSRPFRLIPDDVPRQITVSPVYLQHVPPMAPFIMFPEEYEPVYRDVQIVTRSERVAQPPPIDNSTDMYRYFRYIPKIQVPIYP